MQWYKEFYQKDEFDYGRYAVIEKVSNKLIGICGFIPSVLDDTIYPELSYRFAKAYWGQGLATEAACALRDYARDVLKLKEIISMIEPANVASIRVAEKVGLQFWQHRLVYTNIPANIYRLQFR